jgi:hypothetical protein
MLCLTKTFVVAEVVIVGVVGVVVAEVCFLMINILMSRSR